MISAWHLLWIIPLAGAAGLFIMSLCAINKINDHQDLVRDELVEKQ